MGDTLPDSGESGLTGATDTSCNCEDICYCPWNECVCCNCEGAHGDTVE